MTQNIIIPIHHAHERLDQTLAKLLPSCSRTQIQRLIASGHILVNGQTTSPKIKLKGNELVTIEEAPQISLTNEPQDITFPIVYEDEELLVINKPMGLVVHPGAGQANNTLLNALLHYAPSLKQLPRAGILHRLDKETTGLLLIAKTSTALQDLSKKMKNKEIIREYQAIVSGTLISGGTIDAPIDRHHIHRTRMSVSDTGKSAITHYRLMEKYRAHTHIKIQLETGRTHQIRVHMAHIRHPIVGDKTYGSRVVLAKAMSPTLIDALRQYSHQALHAYALTFTHPVTEKEIRVEIDLPSDMKHLIELLREDHALHTGRLARP